MNKQIDMFKNNAEVELQHPVEIHVDGASRDNPGISGAGIYIHYPDNRTKSLSYYLGKKTNNQAEYLALIFALLEMDVRDELRIFSDSELLVKQIHGDYQVKNGNIKNLYTYACRLLKKFKYTIRHIDREHNKKADKLANLAIDKKIEVSDELKEKLLSEDIQL